LRERNPRLGEEQARRLATLGTRLREDGLLEWKFDPMLCTLAVSGTFHLAYQRAFWRRIAAPTLIVHGAESGAFWHERAGARYLDPDELAARLAAFRNATFVEIPEAGHMVHFDQPTALSSAIRSFLGVS
jgi:pimeloyl-ACP methyl ester carboxylesterase